MQKPVEIKNALKSYTHSFFNHRLSNVQDRACYISARGKRRRLTVEMVALKTVLKTMDVLMALTYGCKVAAKKKYTTDASPLS